MVLLSRRVSRAAAFQTLNCSKLFSTFRMVYKIWTSLMLDRLSCMAFPQNICIQNTSLGSCFSRSCLTKDGN
ncbi:hypothetical protein LWI29_015757 [Acer saccharum]|uniref:Uncharacterized protein n=1 Tax=Acer saccharum TaxID=4024 RepID=A0AA39RQF9_ACESA|nr:hypothetical protein LWI29_015757 [Acer saccharum]